MRKMISRYTFIRKIFLILTIVMIGAIVSSCYLITRMSADRYVETQKNYEYEIMVKNSNKLNEKLTSIGEAITQSYYINDDWESKSLLTEGEIDASEESQIYTYMNQVVRGNPYITDMIIVNKKSEKVYTCSEITYQKVDEDYDWFSDPCVTESLEGDDPIIFKENYEENGYTADRDVCTFAHHLVDIYKLGYEESESVLLVNIPTEELFDHKGIHADSQVGILFVEDENGEILFSNISQEDQVTIKSVEEYAADERYIVIRKSLISWSGFNYVMVLDKAEMYQEYYLNMLQEIIPIILICIAFVFATFVFAIYMMGKRIENILEYTYVLQTGELSQRIQIQKQDEFTSIEKELNTMAGRLNNYIEDKYIADIKLKKAEIKSMQLQINPHFMFNTLESIRAVCIENGKNTSANMIGVLGDMNRWNLRKPDVVTVEEELDYLDYYMELEELKYGRGLYYEHSVPEKLMKCEIPKLTLQPIVENCIRHGMHECENEMIITIETEDDEREIRIFISDNGNGIPEDKIPELQSKIDNMEHIDNLYHIGLRNVNQRIKLLMGNEYGIYIVSGVEQGTTIEVKLRKG